MSYLDRLKGQNSEKQAPKALSKLPKAPFDSFGSSHIAHIQEIEAFPANDAKPEPTPLLVEVYTPSGTPMTIKADNAERAAWLKRMNPKAANANPANFANPEPDTRTQPDKPGHLSRVVPCKAGRDGTHTFRCVPAVPLRQ